MANKIFGIQHVGGMKHFHPLTSVSHFAGSLPATWKLILCVFPGILLTSYMPAFLRILSLILFSCYICSVLSTLVTLKLLSDAYSRPLFSTAIASLPHISIYMRNTFSWMSHQNNLFLKLNSSPLHLCPQSYLYTFTEPIFNFLNLLLILYINFHI